MNLPTEKELRESTFKVIYDIARISGLYDRGMIRHMANMEQPPHKDRSNLTRRIDGRSSDMYEEELRSRFDDDIEIYGEEYQRKPSANFAELNKLVAFIDPIDGTDLQVRGLSNWASAVIYFIPKQRRILYSVVGHGSGDIFHANEKHAYVRPWQPDSKKRKKANKDYPIFRSSKKKVRLNKATICFYGQKPNAFLRVAGHKKFIKAMESLKEQMTVRRKSRSGKIIEKTKRLDFRLYNLGGNPMMVKIPSGAVDAVFSIGGAKAYDVLPGAYIAVKAGAYFIDLKGNEIDIFDRLLHPEDRISYILSGSKALAHELLDILT